MVGSISRMVVSRTLQARGGRQGASSVASRLLARRGRRGTPAGSGAPLGRQEVTGVAEDGVGEARLAGVFQAGAQVLEAGAERPPRGPASRSVGGRGVEVGPALAEQGQRLGPAAVGGEEVGQGPAGVGEGQVVGESVRAYTEASS